MEERKRILKLVEEGKLTAEEAIILLEKLEQGPQATEPESEIVNDLSTHVNFEQEQEKTEQTTYKQTSVKNKFVDFIDSAIKKIKDLDLDFNFGNAVEVSHIFQHSNVYLQEIDLDVANGSIDIVPWDENDVRIECDAKVYKIENQHEARQAFLKDVLFSIENGKLRFLIQKKQTKVKARIFIPRKHYEYIKIRMFNGPISTNGLSVTDFRGKTANGSIKLREFNATNIELEAVMGHIEVLDTTSKDCEIETINGTVNVSGSYEKLDLQSFNGNIVSTLHDDKCHTLHVKTTAGNIDIYTPVTSSIEGELKSNLGGFLCELPNMSVVEEKSEVVQKLLRFKTNQQVGKRCYIFADTKTGSVMIKPTN